MPYRCNSKKLLERNGASTLFTSWNYRKMSNTSLNSSYDSDRISDESTGSLNIVPSTFYSNRKSEYLSPLQRKQLKRTALSSDENANPTPNFCVEEPKKAKPAKRGKSHKSPEVKKQVSKPRSSNSSGKKKHKSSKGLETTTSNRELPKEVHKDNTEKYKNNKFFKHGPISHLKEPISWKIFASGSLKPFSTDRKKQFKDVSSSDKLLEPIENKTVASDIYDSLPDDNAEHLRVAIPSEAKLSKTLNGTKKWIANGFIDTSLPNISVTDSSNLADQTTNGQIPRCQSLPMQGSQKPDVCGDGGVEQQLAHDKISVVHGLQNSKIATRGTKRKQSQLKPSLFDAAEKSQTKMRKNQRSSKSVQWGPSVILDSSNLDTDVSVYSIEDKLSHGESIVNHSSATEGCRSKKRQKPARDKISLNPVSQNLKTEIRENKKKQSQHRLSLTSNSTILENKPQQKLKSVQSKSSVISGPDSLKCNISVSGIEIKSCHESEINDFHISEIEPHGDEKRHKLVCSKSSVIHSTQTPKTKILNKTQQQSSLSNSATASNVSLQSVTRTPQKSDLIQDIFKDLEDTFNEIEPTVSAVQINKNTDSILNVTLFEKEKVLDNVMEKEEFPECANLSAEFLEGPLGDDGFLKNAIGGEDFAEEKTLYSIFCGQEKSEDSSTKSSRRKKKSVVSNSTKTAVPEKDTEFMIDAGQKVIGATECPTCGMVFHVGSEQDEKLHAKNHEMFILHLKFPGWKREHVVGEYYDGRIIMIKREDPNFMLKKVEDVLKIVDRDLGFPNLGFPKRPNATFLLFVFDKTVVGCLVAESITSARRVELDPLANVSSCFPEDKKKAERWCSSNKVVKAICGVNRIWVSREYRRKKIATRLLNCLRCNFLYGYTMSKKEMAFSDPSVNGRDFASVYMGTCNFLVYK